MRVKSATVLMLILTAIAVLGLAVPNISVQVQGIGEGSNVVISPVCNGGFYPTSAGIKVQLGNDLLSGSRVYVVLYDSYGNLVSSNYKEFPEGLPANTPFLVEFDSNSLNSASFDRTKVIVRDGYFNITQPGSIRVMIQKIGAGSWDGEYAQPINITYNGSVPLKNWPVKIVLSNDNPENPYGSGSYYINWPVLQNNIDSIHFVDSNGNLLYYWIEVFHPGTAYNYYDDAYAVIWVNVSEIPPNGTKIWMIYGDGNYSQYNNGKKVFWFFDGFESDSLASDGWVPYNPTRIGSRISDFGFGYKSYRSFNKFNYFDRQDGALKNLSFTIPRSQYNITLEYWDYRENLTRGALDRVGIVDENGNGFGAVMRAIVDGSTLSYIGVDIREDYIGTVYKGTGVQPQSIYSHTWYLMRLSIFTNGSIEVQIFNETGYLKEQPMGRIWYTQNDNITFSTVYIKGGSAYYVDNLRIRRVMKDKPSAKVDEWYGNLVFVPECKP